jgi:DNA-binding XRE family transcriptional regulator
MKINYTKALKQKQTETKLSTEALAKAIGVSPISLRGILKGKSKPNAKTAQKYAVYLGLSADAVAPAKAKQTIGKVTAKPTSAKKTKRGKRGAAPKPARSAKKTSRPTQGLGAQLVEVVSAAAEVLDDQVALAVHRAGSKERELIAHLLSIGQH